MSHRTIITRTEIDDTLRDSTAALWRKINPNQLARARGIQTKLRRRAAFVAVDQHDAGRGDVQGEAQQGREQQHAGEAGEIERAARVQRHHQHRDGNRNVEYEEDIEQQRGDRQHHQRQQCEDADRQGPRGGHGGDAGEERGRGSRHGWTHRPSAFNRS